MPIEAEDDDFFPIEFEGEADSVSVLHTLVDVIAPTKIIDIFTV